MSIGSLAKFGGGVKSVQTGYTSGTGLSSGSGEDTRYRDITISAVADITKCAVSFVGSGGNSAAESTQISNIGSSIFWVSARLTSTTNLRVAMSSNPGGTPYIAGRWAVVEYQ